MKLRFRTKLSYGIGGTADNALFNLETTFLLFFLTSVVGIRPAAAGAILAIGSLWEMVCGPFVGFLSDNTLSRYGKRKPFILAAVIPVSIATTLLFTSLDVGYTAKVVYYLLMTLLFWQAFAMFFVPYITWGSDLTDDYNERTSLRSYAYFFNQVGMAIGMVFPSVSVDLLINMGNSRQASWTMTAAMVGILCSISLLICALTIHETDVPDYKPDPEAKKKIDISAFREMFGGYGRIIKLKPVKTIFSASILFLIANSMFAADRVYYFTYNLSLTAGQISIAMLVITLSGIAFTPVVAWICRLFDKKYVFMAGVGIVGLIMMIARAVLPDSFMTCCVFCALFSFGNTCYWQLMPSLIYDVCEVEELASGERHAGQVISLQALAESLSTAVGLQLLGIILQAAGFSDQAAEQSQSALSWIGSGFTILPGLCMVIVAAVMLLHPLDNKNYRRVVDALDIRKNGGSVDMKEFDHIIGKRMGKKEKD